MSELQVFNNAEFGSVRSLMVNGEPYFVGRDVAKILGYANPNDALAKRVDEEDKGVAKCDTLGGIQELTVINESGLYSLILSSKLPSAKRFKRWVTSEVLPAIRKHGVFVMDDIVNNTDALIEALQPGQTAAVFVGPEGGFEDTEVEAAVREGAKTISLGKRILRTETAALAFLAFLTYRFEL